MASIECMENVFSKCCEVFNITSLKNFQKKCLWELLNMQNVFVSCKTGAGKSMCYELFPVVLSYFPRSKLRCIVIIIELLLSIDEECVNRLKKLGFSATYIGKDDNECSSIVNGDFTFLFTSAENILSVERYRNMLSSDIYQNSDVLLVIDEAHTVINW